MNHCLVQNLPVNVDKSVDRFLYKHADVMKKMHFANMNLIVDYVGFEDNLGRTVVKELAVVSINDENVAHFMIKCPFAWSELSEGAKSSNELATTQVHGIRWEEGSVNNADLSKTFSRVVERATALYAHGAGKCSVLQRLTNRTFIDLEREF